ncbi:alpha-tectorin-like [Antennarius striatus]|uniref:alpha-tectorin-like n=1 Tax=Antennarius striatus TaxID=241820 RepID=UPI0035B27A96
MLRLLLILSALVLIARGQVMVDLTSCPINYFGTTYTSAYYLITNANILLICFDGPPDPLAKGECVEVISILPPLTFSIETTDLVNPAAPCLNGLGTMGNSLSCVASFASDEVTVNFGNFGTRSGLQIIANLDGAYLITVCGAGVQQERMSVVAGGSIQDACFDISGCLDGGVFFRPGEIIAIQDLDTCISELCGPEAITVSQGCEAGIACLGNGMCANDRKCVITGPTIITFDKDLETVMDRCVYTLLSINGFVVTAGFLERTRTDVSFIDYVSIEFPAGTIHVFSQDGEVTVNGIPVTITTTPTTLGSGTIYMDGTGITGSWTVNGGTIDVYFDGDTAHITYSGLAAGSSLNGVCGGQTLAVSRTLTPGCQDSFPDPIDLNVDCNELTARCALLNDPPFTACHGVVEPKSFIEACTTLLCKYPDVDNFNCQFFEAYDKACSDSGVTLPDWRTNLECPDPQPFCNGRRCNDNEYCGVRGDITSCYCRAIFAAPFRDSPAFPVTCEENTACLTVIGCLVEEAGFDYTNLHLNNESCVGDADEETGMVKFTFNTTNTCGAIVTSSGGFLNYTNRVLSAQNPATVITREEFVSIVFSCVFDHSDAVVTFFNIDEGSSVVQIVQGEEWEYTLSLMTFLDAALTIPLDASTEVQLDQKVWVQLSTEGLEDSNVAVVTEHCWATNQAAGSEAMMYNLITGGCPAEGSVTTNGNGEGTSNSFCFNIFQFTENAGDVSLHCEIRLCPIMDGESCVPECGTPARRRRSTNVKYLDIKPAIVSMVWGK